MIRTIIGFFVAALAICTAIILMPFGTDASGDDTGVQTTRTQTAPVTAPVSAPVRTVETPVSGNAGVLAPGVAEAIAPAPAVAGNAAARILAAVRAGEEIHSAIRTDNTSIADTTNGVLAQLGMDAPEPTSQPIDPAMADMTSGVLAGIRVATGQVAEPQGRDANDLRTLVAWALKENQSDAYIDSLVNEAASTGQIAVPSMLVTSDGRVDTATLLNSIVQQATVLTTGQAPAVPTTPLGAADGVEVRVVQRAAGTEQFRFYTVSPGDSLGSISVKFYGSVEHFPQIFEANRQILSSPDRIQAGQRLVIPELT